MPAVVSGPLCSPVLFAGMPFLQLFRDLVVAPPAHASRLSEAPFSTQVEAAALPSFCVSTAVVESSPSRTHLSVLVLLLPKSKLHEAGG